MSRKDDRSVRLSQTLAPFGVGAIYDFRGESLVACDTFHWWGRGQPIDCARLADGPRSRRFRSAPSHASLFGRSVGIPYARFPRWLFCPRCRRMVWWTTQHGGDRASRRRCSNCQRHPQLVPMRFVIVCRNGHMTTFRGTSGRTSARRSRARGSASRKNLQLHHDAGTRRRPRVARRAAATSCGAERTCAGSPRTAASTPLNLRCLGLQPWQRRGRRDVRRRPAGRAARRHQRLLRPHPLGDRHPAGVELRLLQPRQPRRSRTTPTSPRSEQNPTASSRRASAKCSADKYGVPADEDPRDGERRGRPARRGERLHTSTASRSQATSLPTSGRRFSRRTTKPTTATASSHGRALLAQDADDGPLSEASSTRTADPTRGPRDPAPRGSRAVGFSRLRADWRSSSSPISDEDSTGCPAVEVFGEGIFLALDETSAPGWEAPTGGRRRAPTRSNATESTRTTSSARLLPAATPALRPAPHARARPDPAARLRVRLRRRVASENGSTPSRATKRKPQAGLLLYTAAGDVEGTLGGLAARANRRGLPERSWTRSRCAAGARPTRICAESSGQGFSGMNLGACHACALVPETSCDHANALLDRTLVVGSDARARIPRRRRSTSP